LILIGVTGGVGTGKSTVARMFGRLGAKVLDADRIVHSLLQPGSSVYPRILRNFPEAILPRDRSVDRRRLGEVVFGDRKRLAVLNRILHPEVRRRLRQGIRKIRAQDPESVVALDVPLLVEGRPHYSLDALVVVAAPMKAVARRLGERSGWSLAEVKRRRAVQMPLRRKERLADFVVRNDGSRAATRRQVGRIWKQIKENG
jgi:dephospho-CoA kinase